MLYLFQEEFEDSKEVIKIRKSKKKRQQHGQTTIYDAHKTKYRVIRTPLKTGCELRCSGRVGSSSSTSDTRRVNLVTNPVISHE